MTTHTHHHPYPHLTTHLKGEQCWCGEEDTVIASLIDQIWTADEIGHLIRSVQLNYESDFSMTLMKLRELLRDDEIAYGTEFVMTNDPDTMDRVAKL